MFCPRCGSTQSDDIRFCKACGANLSAVRQAVETPAPTGKFNWKETWLSEMMQSSEQAVRRAAEIERIQGITPDVKRRNEIKAGVITGCVGVGVSLLLFFLMQGIILSGKVDPGAAEILRRVWIAGVIPIMVGIALIINGVFITKIPDDETSTGDIAAGPKTLAPDDANEYLPPADTSELIPAGFSVTDETTRHLKEPLPTSARREND